MARLLRTILIVLVVGPGVAAAQSSGGAARVMLISSDGLRPDAIDRAGATVLQGLIAGGSYQATAVDELPSITLPNHASMVTGLSIARHGVLINTDIPGRITATTIFDVATDAGLDVGFFINKTKLGFLGEAEGVKVWKFTADVDSLADEVIAAIESEDLRLFFIHFGDPDKTGHRDGWMSGPYLDAVRSVDAAIGRILDALTAKGIRDETVLIITSDHGGHLNTHGFDIPDDRLIPFILNGPGIAVGRKLCNQVRIMDAAATALDLLGLPAISAMDGRVVTEARADFEQPDCAAGAPPVGFPCITFPVLTLGPLVLFLAWHGRRSRRRRSATTPNGPSAP
ncbi:MAG: ectonucleotide pyrophosphatase/phosphodiesterase [Phycisphaerae bacterium]